MQKVIKVLLLIVLLAATCFGSYKGVIAIWGEDEITSVTESPVGNGSTEVKSKDVKNMLVTAYYYDNYTQNVISYAVVRFFNLNTKECNYLFFPGNTKVDMSNETFSVLYNASSNIKQSCYISDIAPCFVRDSDRYGYTTMLLEDIIKTDIDCYEAITSDNVIRVVNLLDPVSFDVPKKLKFKDDSNIQIVLNKGMQTLLGDQVKGMLTKPELYDSEEERLAVSMDYIENYLFALTSIKDRDLQGDYYKQYYDLVMSDTNFQSMKPYMVYLYQLQPKDIKMTVAEGSYTKDSYKLNTTAIQAFVKTLLTTNTTANQTSDSSADADATTESNATTADATTEATTTEAATTEATTEEATTEEATTEEKKDIDSKDLEIEIYNSTTINGLAARWKAKLENEGLKITATETERNYHLKDCQILVKNKRMGKDLLEFFPNAEIKVDKETLKASGADIRIVLGTNDNI
ncbi:MAG: LCP family protein [Lachnospiraceae bacterium]|nr:LCP family protein [Lachnospiraceae bacterium]